jgi:hypothetical protein
MTPKEKAIELFDKFNNPDRTNYPYYSHNAQQCALIAVEEILKAVINPDETYLMQHSVNYWTEVKKEIEAL